MEEKASRSTAAETIYTIYNMWSSLMSRAERLGSCTRAAAALGRRRPPSLRVAQSRKDGSWTDSTIAEFAEDRKARRNVHEMIAAPLRATFGSFGATAPSALSQPCQRRYARSLAAATTCGGRTIRFPTREMCTPLGEAPNLHTCTCTCTCTCKHVHAAPCARTALFCSCIRTGQLPVTVHSDEMECAVPVEGHHLDCKHPYRVTRALPYIDIQHID